MIWFMYKMHALIDWVIQNWVHLIKLLYIQMDFIIPANVSTFEHVFVPHTGLVNVLRRTLEVTNNIVKNKTNKYLV